MTNQTQKTTISQIIFSQGDWKVLSNGAVENKKCGYDIGVGDLISKSDVIKSLPRYPLHIASKAIFDIDDFIACYDFAIKKFNPYFYHDSLLDCCYEIARKISNQSIILI